jgi:predicted MFS family arabinose efflux permease
VAQAAATETQMLDRPAVIMAAASAGTAAVIVFALLPVLSGVMADHFLLDDVQTGLVATAYFSVYALIALTSVIWIRRVDWVVTTRAGFALMCAGLLLSWLAPGFTLASAGLALVGTGAALLFPISLTLVSDMQNTERAYAIKLAVEQLVPAALLFLLSSTLFAGFGLATLLLSLLVVVVLCQLLALPMPRAGNTDQHTQAREGNARLGMGSLASLALAFAGFAGLWAFLERIAVDNNFDPAFTNTWLGAGLIASGLGPVAAAALEQRSSRGVWLGGGMGIAVLSLTLLSGPVTPWAYACALLLLPFSFYFAMTFLMAVIAAADHNGKMSGLMAFALAVGAGAGPAVFGWLRAGDGPVVMVMGLLILSGTLLALLIQYRLQQSEVQEIND